MVKGSWLMVHSSWIMFYGLHYRSQLFFLVDDPLAYKQIQYHKHSKQHRGDAIGGKKKAIFTLLLEVVGFTRLPVDEKPMNTATPAPVPQTKWPNAGIHQCTIEYMQFPDTRSAFSLLPVRPGWSAGCSPIELFILQGA